MDGSLPLIFSACYGIICFLGMYALPAPGAYLPKVDDKVFSEVPVNSTINKSINASQVLEEF